jgi:16S rRNA (guanine527-N7)-methyltransferase
MSEFAELLAENLQGIVSLTEGQLSTLERHYALLERWNQRLNLTSIRNLGEAVVRHYAESIYLALRVSIFGEICSAVDIGSGAGFPGMPVAVILPDWHVTLVESHQRRAVFLRESTRELPNVRVKANRFEAVRDSFDVGVSRAVSWRDLEKAIVGRVQRIALLTRIEDAVEIMASRQFQWYPPDPLPWNSGAVVLLGSST